MGKKRRSPADATKTTNLLSLPVEIFNRIISHLTQLDVLRLSYSSKRLLRPLSQIYWVSQDSLNLTDKLNPLEPWELCRLHCLVPSGLESLQLSPLNSKLKDTDLVKILRKWSQLQYLSIPSFTKCSLVHSWLHLTDRLKVLMIEGCSITLNSLNCILAKCEHLEKLSFTFNFQLISGNGDDLVVQQHSHLQYLGIDCLNTTCEGWKWRHIHDSMGNTQLGLSFYHFFINLLSSALSIKTLRLSCALLNNIIIRAIADRLNNLSHLELFDSFRFHSASLDLSPFKELSLERVRLEDNDAVVKLFLPIAQKMETLKSLQLRVNDYSIDNLLASFQSVSLREISLNGVIRNSQLFETMRINCPLATVKNL